MISVIIPAYNVEDYLSDCINSIISQTYKDLQIIVVDDGSTDGTGAICDEFAARDSRIEIIHKVNEGVSASRNCGMKVAKGEWISFVDSDDFVHPMLYECLMSNSQHYYDVISFEWCQFWDGENVSVSPISNEVQIEKIDYERSLMGFLLEKKEFPAFAWNKVFRSDFIKGIFFLEQRICEDNIFLTEVLKRKPQWGKLAFPMYFYRKRNESISAKKEKYFKAFVDVLLEQNDRVAEIVPMEIHKEYMIHLTKSIIVNDLKYYYVCKKNNVIYSKEMEIKVRKHIDKYHKEIGYGFNTLSIWLYRLFPRLFRFMKKNKINKSLNNYEV